MLPNQVNANMANPYNLLWPYINNVSALNYNNPDPPPMIQVPLPSPMGTMCSDVVNMPHGDHIIGNIAFQQHQQQKQQHQLQHFHHQQQQQQLQNNIIKMPATLSNREIYLQKLGYEFSSKYGTTMTTQLKSHKISLDNDNENTKNNNNNTRDVLKNVTKETNTRSKKGSSFTIDFILNNNNNKKNEKEKEIMTTDDESIDNESPLSPLSTSVDENHTHQICYSPRNPPSPPTPMDISGSNPQGTLTVLPLMHSTPNSLHSEKAGRFSSRRHERFNEISHPYYQKQFEFLTQHPSFQLHQHNTPHPHEQQQDNHHQHSHPQQHPNQIHQPHLIPHPTPLLPVPHQQNKSPRSSMTLSSPSESPSTTFSSSSSECMTSSRNESNEGKLSTKTKRIRTIFTPEQLERLEAEFERQQYMVGTERFYLASSLNLTEAQVKVWFQNRRIKWRKQHLEQQQARLAQGDLYRDLDDSEEESEPERESEATTSMMSSSSLQEEEDINCGQNSSHQRNDNSFVED